MALTQTELDKIQGILTEVKSKLEAGDHKAELAALEEIANEAKLDITKVSEAGLRNFIKLAEENKQVLTDALEKADLNDVRKIEAGVTMMNLGKKLRLDSAGAQGSGGPAGPQGTGNTPNNPPAPEGPDAMDKFLKKLEENSSLGGLMLALTAAVPMVMMGKMDFGDVLLLGGLGALLGYVANGFFNKTPETEKAKDDVKSKSTSAYKATALPFPDNSGRWAPSPLPA